MASAGKNLSEVKLNIKQIIANIQHLQHNCDRQEEDLEDIKTNTEHMLSELEKLPFESFKNTLKKRRRKQFKNVHRQNQYSNNAENQNDAKSAIIQNAAREPSQNFGRNSKCIKDSKRFLQNFELLEQLHLIRGQNPSETYKFSLKLRHLKTLWNSLLQDKLQEKTSADVTIQQQWNEVLFGSPEKTYFHGKTDLYNFVRKRNVWDFYINNKYGSSIPIGWIVPDAEAKEQWQTYLVERNI